MRAYHILKRIGDIVVSLIGIIALIPLFILIAVWIKFTSKGPVIYTHLRLGKNEKLFKLYKFRTMITGAREMENKGVSKERLITSAGRFLRRTFLDETLQLFNLLKGDISLVGPRPLDKEVFDELTKRDKKWENIVKIKPGLTSLESVADYLPQKEKIKFEESFKNLLDKDVQNFYEHRYVLDSYYISRESFILDVKLIFYTFLLVVKRIK